MRAIQPMKDKEYHVDDLRESKEETDDDDGTLEIAINGRCERSGRQVAKR